MLLSRLYNINVNSKRCISPRRQPFVCFFALQIKKVCFCIEVDLNSCFWPRREHLFLKNMHFVHRAPSRPLGTTTTTTTTTTMIILTTININISIDMISIILIIIIIIIITIIIIIIIITLVSI